MAIFGSARNFENGCNRNIVSLISLLNDIYSASTIRGATYTRHSYSPPLWLIARFRYGACCVKTETGCISSVYDYYVQFTIIVNSLTFLNLTLITSMLIVKLTLFLRYADWLTCHFKRFSIFVL